MKTCSKCKIKHKDSNEGESDPCFGELPGVDNACCGHGDKSKSYIRFITGVVISGFDINYTEVWEPNREPKEVIQFLEKEIRGRKSMLGPDEHIHVMPGSGPKHIENKYCWCEPILDFKDEKEVWAHQDTRKDALN